MDECSFPKVVLTYTRGIVKHKICVRNEYESPHTFQYGRLKAVDACVSKQFHNGELSFNEPCHCDTHLSPYMNLLCNSFCF